jgi:hypothetical protein
MSYMPNNLPVILVQGTLPDITPLRRNRLKLEFMLGQKRQWRNGSNIVLGVLILLAGAECLWRGPVRFAQASNFNDFISPYVQSRNWIRGIDPYSPQNLVSGWPPDAKKKEFLDRDLADGSLVRKRGIPTAYPLPALVLIAPLAILPWTIADILWLAISLAAYVVTILSVRSLANLSWTDRRTYFFLAFALALAPFHTGLAAGSIVIVALAPAVAAIWAVRCRNDLLAGLLLILAISLKPQIGLPFLIYSVLRRHWRAAAIGVAGIAILAAVAIFRLAAGGTHWMQSYLYDNRVLFSDGSLGDFTEKNPIRFGLINLQVGTYAVLGNRNGANILALAITLILGLVWLFLIVRRQRHFDSLLPLSALVVLSLLPVYHRMYDASLLILPLAWSLTALTGPTRNSAKGALLLLALFLVPGGTALEQLTYSGHFAAVQHLWWWDSFVLPHQVWALLILEILLLHAMRSESGEESANTGGIKLD